MYSGVLVAELGGDAVQELFEIYFAAEALEVSNHVEDGRVFGFEAEGLHGRLEFPGIDFAGGLSIEEVEGLSEFLNFVLGESGSLDFLLSSSLHSGFRSIGH